MRRFLAVVALVVTSLPLGAAPRGDGPQAAAALRPEEAQVFAQSLVRVAGEINRYYVRPIPFRTLLYTALAGLYEEARRPVPEGLRAELEKAVKEPAAPANPIEVQVLDPEAVAFVTKVRQQLGNARTLEGTKALRVAIQAMARSLDPYCAVVSGEELRRGNGENLNYGIGLELIPNGGAGPLLVKRVIPGGSAQRKGVRTGDQVTHVNGKSVEGEDADAVMVRMGRPLRSDTDPFPVELTLHRSGRKNPWKVSLMYEFFKPEMVLGVKRNNDETWNYFADPERKLAHVRIGALEHGVSQELQQVLAALKSDGMKGLVLDLRWSPGGFLNEAVLLSRLFLKDGVIASIKNRTVRDDQVYRATGESTFGDFPVVVLVNGSTSGGSELVAAALEDNRRATIVGQRTFGKASVQTMLALPLPNSGLKLTSGNFIRPSGKALHRFPDSKIKDDWGVRPDPRHEWPLTADLGRQLRDWWQELSIRPSAINDPLPLDDPENDPQRQVALKVLAGMVEKDKK